MDVSLVKRGLAPSRERAQAYILEGRVTVDGVVVAKAGFRVSASSEVVLKGEGMPFASRGGLKLESAMERFGVDASGKIALDSGASTGGFTDCLLKRGASRVYAVDVGYGQLAWHLRNDPRVVVMERTNLRYLSLETLGIQVDLVTLDVSFISLVKVWPAVSQLLRPGGEVLSLVKPQFEAGRSRVGKRGVVRDPATHLDVLTSLCVQAYEMGFDVMGTWFSPIKGAEGNVEFWIYMRRGTPGSRAGLDRASIEKSALATVQAARAAFGG